MTPVMWASWYANENISEQQIIFSYEIYLILHI